MKMNAALLVTDLPMLVQEKILQCLSYAELSRVRSISKHFHRLCSDRLNRGYFRLEIIVPELQKQIKAQLPRRESERYKVRSQQLRIRQRISFVCLLASSLSLVRHHLLTRLPYSMAQIDLRFGDSKCTLLFLSGSSKRASVHPSSHFLVSFSCSMKSIRSCTIYNRTNRSQTSALSCKKHAICRRWPSSISESTSNRNCNRPVCPPSPPFVATIRYGSPATSTPKVRFNALQSTSSVPLHSYSAQCHHKRINNALLRRQVAILNQRTYRQNLIMKSQKYQMKRYRQVIHMRTKALINYHRRLKYLEKKSKASEQLLLEVRKDNDTLLQRFDQFTALYDPTTAKHRKVD